jgi:hypothetical protein
MKVQGAKRRSEGKEHVGNKNAAWLEGDFSFGMRSVYRLL